MKKIILVTAVLMLAGPAWGVVMITCEASGSNEVTVYYDMNDVNGLIRIAALDITVDNGAVITGVSGYKIGESVAGDKGFGLFMASFRDYIEVNVNGEVENWDDPNYTPLADPCDEGALGGIGTSGITVELGSLYYPRGAASPNAPDTSGILLKFTVDKDCNITIAENMERAGVVMEDVSSAATNLPYTWGISRTCVGDVDENGKINKADITALAAHIVDNASPWFWLTCTIPPCKPEADVDCNGKVNKADIVALAGCLVDYASAPFWTINCADMPAGCPCP